MSTRFVGLLPLFLLFCCNFVSAIPSSGCTPNSSAPGGAICGENGSNPKYATAAFAYQTLGSVTDCQNLCLRRTASGDASCENFSYDSSSSLCTISSGALMSISKSTTSNVVFYERACFTCPNPCSLQKTGQNLLDNSGFELSSTYLGPWYSSDTKGIGKTGDKSKRSFACTAGKSGKCSIRQSYQNCNPGVYKWSYNFKSSNKKSNPFHSTASFGGNSHSLSYPKSATWQTYSDVFQMDTDFTTTAMLFNLLPGKSSNGGTFEADNIKIEPTDFIVQAEPDAFNSLPNGQFGNGKLAPWTQTKPTKNQDVSISTKAALHPAKYGLRWNIKNGEKNPSFGIQQPLYMYNKVTVPGKAYLFNYDEQNNLPQSHKLNQHPTFLTTLEIFTGNNGSVPNIHNTYTNIHVGQLGSVRIPFMGQKNQNYVRFTITVLSPVPASGPYYFNIDNISFKQLGKS